MKNQKHILVIRLSAMGDVAMTAVVIKAFVAQNPDTKITMLSRAFLKPIFEDIPNVNFYAADTKGKHKGILGIYKLYKELKTLNIDAVAIPISLFSVFPIILTKFWLRVLAGANVSFDKSIVYPNSRKTSA